jgi:hypothetical protein
MTISFKSRESQKFTEQSFQAGHVVSQGAFHNNLSSYVCSAAPVCSANSAEQKPKQNVNAVLNSTVLNGIDTTISTLSRVKQEIVEQKFYTVDRLDRMIPLEVSSDLGWIDNFKVPYSKYFAPAQGQESGFIGSGKVGELNQSSFSIAYQDVPLHTWASGMNYSFFEQQKAAANQLSIDTARTYEEQTKKSFDLFFQEAITLGKAGTFSGLLSIPGATNDTTTLTGPLSDMTPTELSDFLKKVVAKYDNNCNSAMMPDTFVIPREDFLGLAIPYNDSNVTQGVFTRLDYMKKVFTDLTNNPDIAILPLRYGNATEIVKNADAVSGYVLYSAQPDVVRATVTVPYTTGTWQTPNSYQFESFAYSRFSEVYSINTDGLMYFSIV